MSTVLLWSVERFTPPDTAPRPKQLGSTVLRRVALSPESGATRHFVLSTGDVDRAGDVVSPDGWKLDAFQAHPICLFGHNSSEPIGQWHSVQVKDGALVGELELFDPDVSPRTRLAHAVVDAGLAATSVGFRPLKHEPLDPADPWGGYRFLEQELLEVSIVSVPANASALQLACKALNLPENLVEEFAMEAPVVVPDPEPVIVEAPDPPVLRAVPAPAVIPSQKKARNYSLQNVLRGLSGDTSVDLTFEREISGQSANLMKADRPGFHVPLSVLFAVTEADRQKASGTTANVVGGAGGVGVMNPLTGIDVLSVEAVGAALERQLVAGVAGVRVVSTSERKITIPTVSNKPGIDIVAIDADVGLKDVSFAGSDLWPVTAGARMKILRSAMYAHNGEEILRNLLSRALIEKLDAICVAGNTVAPVLPGLINGTISVAAPVVDDAASAEAAAYELESYTGQAGSARFLADPRSIAIMKLQPLWTGATVPTVQNGTLAGRPVYPVLGMPAGAAGMGKFLTGGFENFVLALFGPSATIEVNPYMPGSWENGAHEIRILTDFSTGFIDPKGVLVSESPVAATP